MFNYVDDDVVDDGDDYKCCWFIVFNNNVYDVYNSLLIYRV